MYLDEKYKRIHTLEINNDTFDTKDLGVNVIHIESRKSARRGSEYEILVDVECDSKRMEQLTRLLSREVAAINLAQYEQMGNIPHAPSLSAAPSFGKSCIFARTRFAINSIHYSITFAIFSTTNLGNDFFLINEIFFSKKVSTNLYIKLIIFVRIVCQISAR